MGVSYCRAKIKEAEVSIEETQKCISTKGLETKKKKNEKKKIRENCFLSLTENYARASLIERRRAKR